MTSYPTTTAIFSLYNPDPSVVSNVKRVWAQVNDVVIVDDGSTVDVSWILDQLRALGCQVLQQTENTGIAAALNAGLDTILSEDDNCPDFILTMDQDSILDEDYVPYLLAAFTKAQEAQIRIGMVAPGIVEGLPRRSLGKRGEVILGDEPIQSGLLIPTAVVRDIGYFMSELFIDGVDSEFYLRAKAAHYEVVLAPRAQLGHSLGNMVPARIFGLRPQMRGRPLLVRTAATMRYYYIYRNKLLLARKYWHTEPIWVLRGLILDLRHLVIVTILVPGRVPRLREAAYGICDGFKSRSGSKSSARN